MSRPRVTLLALSACAGVSLAASLALGEPRAVFESSECRAAAVEVGERGVVTAFATHYEAEGSRGARARARNIERAIELIGPSGVALQPGERFSFNEIVGERSEGRGFVRGPAYSVGTPRWDWGGGICQVSTTILGVALRAGLTIVERWPHTRPVPYAQPGLDAQVHWAGSRDLVVENPFPYPVTLRVSSQGASTEGGSRLELRAEIVAPGPGYRVTLRRTEVVTARVETATEIEPGRAPGYRRVVDEGSEGYRITLERSLEPCAAGLEPRVEQLTSRYPMMPRRIVLGPGASTR